MAVTETTTVSWLSRLGGSIKGVLFGLLVFVAGFPVLFSNEGRCVRATKALEEGEGACISLESNAAVDPDYEGKLVHVTGKAETEDELADDDFGVKVKAIALERKVEMFQWVEDSQTSEKKNLGGSVTKTTTYSYKQKWTESAIDSSSFHEAGHDNPGAIEFASGKTRAANVSFGAFRLSEKQIARLGGSVPLTLDASFTSKVARVTVQGNTIYVPNRETRLNALNQRDVVAMPRVGDMRVTFRVVRPHEISLVAKQHGDTFVDYTAKNGKKISLLTDGAEDAAAMFATAQSANGTMTWVVRFAGFFLMYLGLSMVLRPLSVLADVLPILGTIVEIGTGFIAGVVSAVCALVTVGVAWIFYRPVLGIVLIVAGAALVFFVKTRSARRPTVGSR